MRKTKLLLPFVYYEGDIYETRVGALNAASVENSNEGEHVNAVVISLADGKWALAHLDGQ